MPNESYNYYRATTYIGQYIGDKIPFLKDTSCMSLQARQQIAFLESFKDYLKTELDLETYTLLYTVIKPYLEKRGFADWLRDTVTDMAIRKGLGEGETEFWGSNTEQTKSDTE